MKAFDKTERKVYHTEKEDYEFGVGAGYVHGGFSMKCPYCNQDMMRGKLYSPAERGIYWLPDGVDLSEIKGWCLQEKRIHAAGGMVLDNLLPAGFIVRDRPDSFYCKTCHIFLTKCINPSDEG